MVAKGYSTYIYSIDELKERVLEAEGGTYPTAIAFDKKAGMIYGLNSGTELVTFTGNGLVNKSYDLVRISGGSTTQLLVHPDGYKVIVLTQPNIIVVNLPN